MSTTPSTSSDPQRGQDLAGTSGQDPNFVQNAFAKIADRYVLTNHVCSLGIDILWRKRAGKIAASFQPDTILDLAAGTGDLALQLQKDCPDAQLLATDFCPEMLAHASTRGVKNTQVADALDLPFADASQDLVTVAFGLRNMSNWEAALAEMHRVLKPHGHLLILDFSLPKGLLGKAYAAYLNHVLPKIAGLLTGEGQAYQYLAGSIEKFPSGEAMKTLLENASYTSPTAEKLSLGIASIYTAQKAPDA